MISRKMKGLEMGINVMFSIFLALIVFAVIFMAFMTTAGYLGPLSQMFCNFDPSWCGLPESCVCCEVNIKAQGGSPYFDISSKEYLWMNTEDCRDLIRANGGKFWWKESDPNLARCGNTPNATIISPGIRVNDTCAVPERYVSNRLASCVCCAWEPLPGAITVGWDARWRCQDRDNYTIADSDTCGPLWIMPPESQEMTLKRIGKYFGIMGQYCNIPYPYNLTEQP